MPDWLDSVAGPGYTQAVFWTFGALLLLVIVLIIIKLIRSMTFGTFVAGGRNRKTRLAVMDATAVDSHRRLILVRRDDVEHLLLIGGPTDVVVERDIKLGQRRPIAPGETTNPVHSLPLPQPAAPTLPQPAARAQRPADPVRPAPQAAPRASAPAAPRADVPQPPRGPAPRQDAPKPAPAPAPIPPRQEPRPAPAMPPATPFNPPLRNSVEDLDDELLKELQVSLDETEGRPEKRPAPSLDDEMTKLLGELSSPRK